MAVSNFMRFNMLVGTYSLYGSCFGMEMMEKRSIFPNEQEGACDKLMPISRACFNLTVRVLGPANKVCGTDENRAYVSHG